MRKIALSLLVLVFLLTTTLPAWANSVETLPQGVFALGVKFGYKWAKRRFDKNFGTKTTSIVKDYNVTIMGKDLDAALFDEEDIAGTTDVTYENYGLEVGITTAVGITDNLSAMLIIPIQKIHNSIQVGVHGSNLYLVRDEFGNPALIAPKKRWDEQLSSAFPDWTISDRKLTVDEFKEVLTCRANTMVCQYRYKPLQDFDRWGLGEVIAGIRYKFQEEKYYRHGLTVFFKFPTGRHVDTDNLFDSNFGDQQVDMGFWYGIDLKPHKTFTFNVSFGYTDQFPDVKEKRIFTRNRNDQGSTIGTIPLAVDSSKMKIHRDIGGNWDAYWGFGWSFVPWLSYSNEFYFFWKYEDNYWNAEGELDGEGNVVIPDYRAMEYGTDQAALEMTNMIGFSTIDWVQKGKFPVPLMLGIGYTVGLAGKNFEQNHSVWASLDLVGSIYMFDGGEEQGEAESEMDRVKMPGRSETDDVDPDRAMARRESKHQNKMGDTRSFMNSFGKVQKLGW